MDNDDIDLERQCHQLISEISDFCSISAISLFKMDSGIYDFIQIFGLYRREKKILYNARQTRALKFRLCARDIYHTGSMDCPISRLSRREKKSLYSAR